MALVDPPMARSRIGKIRMRRFPGYRAIRRMVRFAGAMLVIALLSVEGEYKIRPYVDVVELGLVFGGREPDSSLRRRIRIGYVPISLAYATTWISVSGFTPGYVSPSMARA